MFKFQFFYQKSFQLELFAKVSGIYPSSFTNVCFWTKIEILNVVKCRYGFQGAVSHATSSWQSHGGGLGVKPLKDLDLFTFVGHINSLKLKESSKLIFFWKQAQHRYALKIKFYDDWVWKLSFSCRLPGIRIAWINPWEFHCRLILENIIRFRIIRLRTQNKMKNMSHCWF